MDANTTSVSDHGYQADLLWVKTINRHIVCAAAAAAMFNATAKTSEKSLFICFLLKPNMLHAWWTYNALPRIDTPQAD